MEYESQDLNALIFKTIERLMDEDLTDEQLKKEIARAERVFDGAKTAMAGQALVLKAYDMFDGSFGKIKLPSYFNKDINKLLEDKTDGKETTGRAPLLHFRGERVSQEDCKGKKLLGNQHAL